MIQKQLDINIWIYPTQLHLWHPSSHLLSWSYGYDLVLVSTGTDRNITLTDQKKRKVICYPSVFDKAWNKWLSLCSAGLGVRFSSQYLQTIFVSSPSDIQHLNLKPAHSENHQGCPCFAMISQLTDFSLNLWDVKLDNEVKLLCLKACCFKISASWRS